MVNIRNGSVARYSAPKQGSRNPNKLSKANQYRKANGKRTVHVHIPVTLVDLRNHYDYLSALKVVYGYLKSATADEMRQLHQKGVYASAKLTKLQQAKSKAEFMLADDMLKNNKDDDVKEKNLNERLVIVRKSVKHAYRNVYIDMNDYDYDVQNDVYGVIDGHHFIMNLLKQYKNEHFNTLHTILSS